MSSMTEMAATRRTAESRRRWLLKAPALVTIVIASVGPLAVMLVYSVMAKGAFGGVALGQFSLDGWMNVFVERDPFDDTLVLADANLIIFWRSIKLALVTTLATLLVGFPTAYYIATRAEQVRSQWMLLITIPFWTNLLIRTFAIMGILSNQGPINNILIWAGLIDKPMQMLFTDGAVLLGLVYVYLPLMVLPIYASLERMDFNLVEAGYDLYATRSKVLWHIVIPSCKPGLIAGSILVFIPAIGAYVTPRVLGGGKNMMMGNLIELQFGQGRNWPLGAALSICLLLIVTVALIIYIRGSSGKENAHGR
ncbi:ABC transporter permease [Mesorhizobium sp. 131-2-1]|uniref:ABC transporter permease n=1 Tax=Mesorhizobium sp. 131-2-1 TaxID=2744518 RepID=UPI0019297020|nr:ABC transporter permease [Mesorhizobium sp. 131-2-1]BCG93547.1 ABC transporter permease [Mesorhizobium sp. 131-2-1]